MQHSINDPGLDSTWPVDASIDLLQASSDFQETDENEEQSKPWALQVIEATKLCGFKPKFEKLNTESSEIPKAFWAF